MFTWARQKKVWNFVVGCPVVSFVSRIKSGHREAYFIFSNNKHSVGTLAGCFSCSIVFITMLLLCYKDNSRWEDLYKSNTNRKAGMMNKVSSGFQIWIKWQWQQPQMMFFFFFLTPLWVNECLNTDKTDSCCPQENTVRVQNKSCEQTC